MKKLKVRGPGVGLGVLPMRGNLMKRFGASRTAGEEPRPFTVKVMRWKRGSPWQVWLDCGVQSFLICEDTDEEHVRWKAKMLRVAVRRARQHAKGCR